MEKKNVHLAGIGLIFGTALGGGVWIALAGGAPAAVWMVAAGTGIGLVIGAAAESMRQHKRD